MMKPMEPIKLDNMQGLKPVHTSLALETRAGESVARVAKIEKLEQDDANTYVRLTEPEFHNGVVEVEVCAQLLPDAPPHARGFIGLVFRANADDSEFEAFYIRPTNGRGCTDPVRRQHACQYFAFPGYTFAYFREFEKPGYEAALDDIALGEWSRIRAEIVDDAATFYVNGREALTVKPLLHGRGTFGALGLYVDIGTDGFFRNLSIQRYD